MVEVDASNRYRRRAVGRTYGLSSPFSGWEDCTAAGRQRLELPVALDELQDRDVVAIT